MSSPRTHVVTIIGIALAMLLLFLALRGADQQELATLLRNADPLALLLAAGLLLVSFLLRARRWHLLLGANGPLPYLTVFWATMTGYLGNSYLPARAGEVLRTMLLGRRTGWSRGFIFGTVLVERGLDVVALVALGGAAVAMVDVLPMALARPASVMGLVAVVAMASLLAVEWVHGLVEGIVRRLPLKPERVAWVLDLGALFFQGVKACRSPTRAGGFAAITLIIWLLDAGTMIVIAKAVGLSFSFGGALLLVTALGLSSAVPSTPGFIGVYQFVAVTVLAPFGYSQSQSLATVLAFQFVLYAVITVAGLFGLWRLRRSVRL